MTSSNNNSSKDSILPLSDGTAKLSPTSCNQNNDNNNNSASLMIDVSETLPSINTIQQFLSSSPTSGAISTFTGITRNNFNGKTVTHLSYEGYIPMAIKELTSICNDAKAKYKTVDKLVAVHIIGDCPVGSASVVVGCCSPHRREAIQCTEYLIDELKGRVPIWKKESYAGDDEDNAVWKENVEWHDGRRRRVMVKEDKKDDKK